MKERPEPNQKIDVSHSQNVITIQAGRDVHYHEAERPLNNEEGTRKAPHKEPELRRNKMKRETIPQKIKDKLLVEAMHRCCLCPQHEDITETHHIWPISEKGPNTEDNLMVVCPTCHAKIHRRPRMYTVKQLKEYKERWVSRCAQGIPIEMLIPSLHHQTEPEPNFVGRVEMLSTITGWYNDPSVHIGALIGWGGVGKSALVRRWYDTLTEDNIQPDGIFWWEFYGNAYLERFLEELLEYLAQGRIDVKEIKEAWQRVEKIKEFIAKGEYLIILDGLEEMQKGEEKGAEFGCLKHREFIDLLKFIADVNIRGLCLITTRYPLKDIENYRALTYQNIEVEQLGLDDARALFRKFGVRGEQDEIDKVINEYDGHALSLTLLCGHIVEKFDGDIKKAGEIPSFHSDKEAGGKAHRILLWYKSQLNEEQLAFLKIFSIFRKQVTEKDFEGVFRSKMGHCLVDMSIFSFMGIVDNLCKRRLITKGQDTYTTHPLIKNYFESIFNEEDKRLCHKHIYQYIGSYAPEKPNTLEEMQPLFEQVYHGCSARLYDEVYKLYDEKICRKEEYFLQDKLSALETNLSLVKTFFPKGDLSQMPLVSKKSAQSWLLNEAGLTLLSTGRPKEAEELFIRKTNMQIEDKDWKNASVGYRNLTELQFRIGEIEKALLSAKKALELSEKAKFDQFIVYSKSYLAWILHLLGKTKEAEKGFREADELEAKISGYRLCSIRGVFYADFLISINRVDEASELTQRNLEICQRNNWPDDISRCYRTLSAIERIKENYKEACDHLQKAIEIARRVGMPSLEIKALLESGRLHLDTENYQDAISDANQVLKLCDRTGFKFYEPEAELILAKAYLAQNDLKQAKSCANSAYDKATSMHYYQPKIEAEGLVAKLSFKDSICYTK